MKPIGTNEKLELVKATMINLGISVNEMTVAEAYDIFLVIEKKITWYQYMAICRTLVEQ